MADGPEIILFHYHESINSHRLLWYFRLRGIPYSECRVLNRLPRPVLEELGLAYRRIPFVAIGRDIYCDCRLIFRKLEELFPQKDGVSLQKPYHRGIEKLLESYVMEGGVFWKAVSLIPGWRAEQLKDPEWIADRSEMIGVDFNADLLALGRPEGMAHVRMCFELMENTLLADDRKWILGGESPTLADLQAIWPFEWLIVDELMKETLPENLFSAKIYPKTYTWVNWFMLAVKAGESKLPEPPSYSEKEAAKRIFASKHGEPEGTVDPNDPLGLRQGQEVEVFPTDNASNHKDQGTLSGLDIFKCSIINSKGLQIHFPRWNFRVQPATPPAPSSTTSRVGASKMMRLIYHPLSPYSRKVYMMALELGLTDRMNLEKVVVAPIHYPGWSDNNSDVSPFNPLGKIPVLVPEDYADGIFDSQVILEYLESEAAGKKGESGGQGPSDKHKWRLKTLQSCADGMLDAQVLVIYEKKIRAERGIQFDEWIDGQMEKIMRGFDKMEMEAARGTLKKERSKTDGEFSAAEVTVLAALGFFDIMQLEWRESRPVLTEWFDACKQRESFTRTAPDIDWKTGGKGEAGLGKEPPA